MKRLHSTFSILAIVLAFVLTSSAQTRLTGLDGTSVAIDQQRGKVVILAVGASWLPLTAKQVEYTNILAKRYAGKDVVIYFVATDSQTPRSRNFASNEDLEKFATSTKLAVPVLRDPDGAGTLKKYGIDQLPSFIVLDKSGVRTVPPFGGIDPKHDITVNISKTVDSLL